MNSKLIYTLFLFSSLLVGTTISHTSLTSAAGQEKPLLVPKSDGILPPLPIEESSEGEAVAQESQGIVISPTGGCIPGSGGPGTCIPCDPGIEGSNCIYTSEIEDWCLSNAWILPEYEGWCRSFGYVTPLPEPESTTINPGNATTDNIEERTSENSDTNTKKPTLQIKDKNTLSIMD